MADSPSRSYADALRDSFDSSDNMIALQAQPDPTRDAGVANASPGDALNLTLTSTAHNPSDQATDPDLHWDGERVTLPNFLAALELDISQSSDLYMFATQFYVPLSNGKTAIVHPGQAAQLDGALARPDYSWYNAAPGDALSYVVDVITIRQSYHSAHERRVLLNPALDPTPPVVPAGAPYLVDPNLYVVGTALFNGFRTRLRNAVLHRISNAAARKELGRRFTDGRALLDELRAQANTVLSSSQVAAILGELNTMTQRGLVSDTSAAFKRWDEDYVRLHDRIPAGNASRDTDAMRAMRYIQVVTGNRPNVGMNITNHLRSAHADQNDPAVVRAQLVIFLDDAASIARLCAPAAPPPAHPGMQALTSQVEALAAALAARPDPRKGPAPTQRGAFKPDVDPPCWHCGGKHWNNDCTHKDKGTQKFRKQQVAEKNAKRGSKPTSTTSTADKDRLALVTQQLQALSSFVGAPVNLCVTAGAAAAVDGSGWQLVTNRRSRRAPTGLAPHGNRPTIAKYAVGADTDASQPVALCSLASGVPIHAERLPPVPHVARYSWADAYLPPALVATTRHENTRLPDASDPSTVFGPVQAAGLGSPFCKAHRCEEFPPVSQVRTADNLLASAPLSAIATLFPGGWAHARRRAAASAAPTVPITWLGGPDAQREQRLLAAADWPAAHTVACACAWGSCMLALTAQVDAASSPPRVSEIRMVVDSGCTLSVHTNLADLVRVRACDVTFTNSTGARHACTQIGDIDAYALDLNGLPIRVTITDVYCMPDYAFSLLSVHHLTTKGARIHFGATSGMSLPDGRDVPFSWNGTTYGLLLHSVCTRTDACALGAATAPPPSTSQAVPSPVPSAYRDRHSSAHLTDLSATDAAAAWHARLHVGQERLRAAAAPDVATGISPALARAPRIDCESCKLATARALPHGSDRANATRPGERVFCDIAGPFVTAVGGYKYFLLCVDDSTRYQFFYPMKLKSDAPDWATRLLADFRHVANHGHATGDVRIESVHTDNGGELVSARFFELADSSAVARTFAPAHVHQANGIAERGIGLVCEKIRTLLLSSSADVKYWAYAGAAAVDIFNSVPATHGATVAMPNLSPLQRINGSRPNLLSFLPFGCAAIVTVHNAIKSTHGPRGARGINLGRCSDTPGAYHVLLRDQGNVVVTSDVIFNEALFPWRDSQPVHSATTSVLILFNGPRDTPDSLAGNISSRGGAAVTIDNDAESAGGWDEDLLNDACFNALLSDIQAEKYTAVHAAIPCSTCTVARFFDAAGTRGADDKRDGGPPPVRTREHPDGLPDDLLPASHRRELSRANELIRRTCMLLRAAHEVGTHFTIENPADRSSADSLLFVHSNHGSLWRTSWVSKLLEYASARTVTFAMCSLGSPYQKYTTIAYTPALHRALGPLATQSCSHPPGTHELRAGGREADGSWASRGAAAYPPALNIILADALTTPRAPPGFSSSQALSSSQAPHADLLGQPAARDSTRAPPAVAPAQASPPSILGPRPGGGTFELRTRSLAAAAHACLPAINALLATTTPTQPFVLITSAEEATHSLPTPKTWKAATAQDEEHGTKWMPAGEKELAAVDRNGTLIRIDQSAIPHGRRVLNLLWVFKVKRDGTFKARLCVQGSRQQAGKDFDQTWAGTMRASSLRALTAIAARHGFHITRWDLTSAYLQGELQPDEYVYVRPPPGQPTVDAAGNPVFYKVAKPLYGLVQAGRRFQRTLFPWLVDYGFKPCDTDPCVFTLKDPHTGEAILLGAYVDDLCTVHSDGPLFDKFRHAFFARWEAEDEGAMTDLLNAHLRRGDDGTITLHQQPYIEGMMERFLPDGPPARLHSNSTPSTPELAQHVADALALDVGAYPELGQPYSSLVGALLYAATHTRPDIAYAVGMLSRVLARPTPELMADAERVLGYLHFHSAVGLRYAPGESTLMGYSDSDWAVRHSTSGWVILFQRAAIAYGSKKQKSVALSSCEAEIVAASVATQDAIYARRLLAELGIPIDEPTPVAVDNRAARDLAFNPEHHERTKHIERRHFFVREAVEDLLITVPFVASHDNLADFFTKHLAPKYFFAIRDAVMNVPK